MHGIDIRIARIRSGMKQYQLAGLLGIPQTTLSQIEAGKRTIAPEFLAKIMQFLDNTKEGGSSSGEHNMA